MNSKRIGMREKRLVLNPWAGLMIIGHDLQK